MTWHNTLVSYYPSKVFVILDNNSDAMTNVTKHVTQRIHAEDLHPNNYIMMCNRAIPYASNTVNKIHISSDL